ncbi:MULTISPECIES: N-methyl-L-tryptophan oxidase [unclassified Brevibacterium]|uniref:N-methyl-L-tryptophan oxidase n=1 Tax=unclassified Brevibacterium TaxID=2614124 RepID=UPI00143D3C96|nr:N-methyl-L-tryptophan oxidase [Brevibacterium sp. S22]
MSAVRDQVQICVVNGNTAPEALSETFDEFRNRIHQPHSLLPLWLSKLSRRVPKQLTHAEKKAALPMTVLNPATLHFDDCSNEQSDASIPIGRICGAARLNIKVKQSATLSNGATRVESDPPMSNEYSHIVVGAGSVGSAAAYWLSQRGAERVLVLEQYDLLHQNGSFSDHSRIIRRVYPSTDYVRLSDAMFDAWSHVESASGLPLYTKTGGLDLAEIGTTGYGYVEKSRATLDALGIPYEDLNAVDIRRRFPQWRVSDDTEAIWQADSGILDIRRSVSAHISLALAAGVEFRGNARVENIDMADNGVTVQTATEEFHADRIVVAVGSWLGTLMGDLGLSFNLTLSQEQVTYFSSKSLSSFTPDRHPIWIHHAPNDVYYGFPVYGEAATKVARDMRSRFINSEDRVFEGDDIEGELLAEYLREHLPDAAGPSLLHRTCVYDMPPDRGFVLDTLPGHPHVAVFNGAGHAGKFSSLMGQILADLQTTGSTPHPIAPFTLNRPAIADPNYDRTFTLPAPAVH